MHQAMPNLTEPPRREREVQILDLAATLIQTRGYSAFSYQDIADALDIRKASIHYYFPSKADLGLAAIERYAFQINAQLAALETDGTLSAREMISAYLDYLNQIARTSDKFCLAGAMAAELMALPEGMRNLASVFFREQQEWLARTIKRGFDGGEILSPLSAMQIARLILSAMEGALLIKRTTGDVQQMQDVVDALLLQIFGSKTPAKTT